MKKSLMTLAWLLTIALVGLFLPHTGAPAVDAQAAVVRFHFFYSQDCADCQAIKDEFLPDLTAQYGDQIEINYLDVSDALVLEQRKTVEKRHGMAPVSADTPQVYIGDQVLVGAEQIRGRLPTLIDQYLAQGGADLPELPAIVTDKPVARFLMFYGVTCPHCHTLIQDFLPGIYEKYGDQVQSRYLEIYEDVDNGRAFRGLLLKLDVPPDRAGGVPTVIIGDKVLVGSGEIPAYLEGYIDQYLAQGGVDYPSLENLPQPIEVLVFFDASDDDLMAQLGSVFEPLGMQYGAWLRAYVADLSQADGREALAEYNAALGVSEPPAGTPQVLIGRQMLVGMDDIQSQLPGLIEAYKAEGGIALLTAEELTEKVPTGTPAATPETTEQPTAKPVTEVAEPTQGNPIYLAYFEEAGCQVCARTANDLQLVKADYPQLIVETFSIEQDAALNEWLSQQYGVPEEKRLSSPMIFVGRDVLIDDDVTLNSLIVTVAKYAATGAERTWDDFDPEQEAQAEQTLVERYKSLGALTVLGAGLINGLNPCAFVTIVFFLSYLAFMERRGRQVLIVGVTFTVGVFVAYLLAGLGLSRLMGPLADVQVALKRVMFSVTTVLCLVLAGVSLHDYLKARQGKIDEMKLKLSLDMRRHVHKVIREGAAMRGFYLVAFVVGVVVSLIQLTCTSPIYIGIVFLVHEVPEMQANAYLYLLLYNLAYIVPLVIVFVLAYFGTSSEQLGEFITKRTAAIKLLTTVIFLLMAGWLIYNLVSLLG